jgi:hypothetical protein
VDGDIPPHPVAITSPFPPAECGRRLEEATARGAIAGSLGPIFTGGPRRRLFGRVSPARVRVSRLGWGRGGSLPRFDGRIETAPDGGTVLRGTIGPAPGHLPILLVILAEWSVNVLLAVASGIRHVAAGHPHQALPDFLVPSIMLAFYVYIVAFAPRQIRSLSKRLLGELGEILGATATMEG